MKALFAPATLLMNRMIYPVKFALLGVLAFIAFASLMLALAGQLNSTIQRAESQMRGGELMHPVARMIELTQQHRGLSSMVLGGNQDASGRRAEREAEVQRALERVASELDETQRNSNLWRQIGSEWSSLRANGMQASRSENFARHTALIGVMLHWQGELSDQYGLGFAPEAGSFYLMNAAVNRLPMMLEYFGQLRARGSGVLAQGALDTEARLALAVLNEEIGIGLRLVERDLLKVAAVRPELATALNSAVREIHAKAREVDQVVQAIVMQDNLRVMPAQQFFELTTAGIAIGYSQVYEVLLPTLDTLLQQRRDEARNTLHLNILVLGVALLIIGYLSVGAYLSVMGSIRSLRHGSQQLAAGDLRTHINLDASDELRYVASSFNEMADSMRGLIGSIKHNAFQVADSAGDLAAASGQIHVSSQRQTDAASSMAAAVEQMTVGIEHIARSANEADGLARHSGELSDRGGQIVAAVVEQISEIAAESQRSARTIEELGERSSQISAIVDVIGDIAAQTNLLALNAAIEAARAGEAGRGFAVVADEVRKLAERTANSTREITDMVGLILEGSQQAVTRMEQGVERVNQGVERAREAGDAMQLIRDGAEKVLSTVAEISHALSEQSTASNEIAQQVETIANMARENGDAVGANHQTANRLGELADTLQQKISHFTTD
ncbi:MAG: methyl-accepting chemotaxis protein [Halopseudomonas yangmingensis]